MASAIGNARGLDLNNASEEQLQQVGGLGSERARRIVQARPLRTWDDVQRIEGFSEKLVDDLKRAGATLS